MPRHIEQLFGENADFAIYRSAIAPGVNGHPGIDLWSLRDPVNQTPILACADGEVVYSGVYPNYPLRGTAVGVALPGDDLVAWFYHLSLVFVAVGQKVKQGEVIAMMGRSGTGDPWEPGKPARWHLHWGVWSKKQERFIDPAPFLVS